MHLDDDMLEAMRHGSTTPADWAINEAVARSARNHLSSKQFDALVREVGARGRKVRMANSDLVTNGIAKQHQVILDDDTVLLWKEGAWRV